MAESVNSLSLVLNQQDSAGANVLNRSIGAISYPSGIVGLFKKDKLLTTGATTQNIPAGITDVLQWYIKNTHATAIITITATPTGGASAIIGKLGPGEVKVPCWAPAAGSGLGFTAISLQSDTAGATFEQFIGG